MRVTTLIKKLFGEDAIADYMETLDSEDKESVLEFYTIQREEDASEPDYFVKLFIDGLYQVKDLKGNTIVHTYDVKELKKQLKVLAQSSN